MRDYLCDDIDFRAIRRVRALRRPTAGEFDWVVSKIEQDDTYRG